MSLDLISSHWRKQFQNYTHKYQEPEAKQKIEEKIEYPQRDPFLSSKMLFDDVLPTLLTNRFYALSVLGPQGSGKSVLASEFGTHASNAGFKVVYAHPDDEYLQNLDEWIGRIKREPADKYCFILDDLSYIIDTTSRKNQSVIKNFISRIRHEFEIEMTGGRQLTKPVFIIYISHRLHAVPPMLRNSGSWIFSSMQAADREDALKLIAKRKEMRDRLDSIYMFISKATIEGPRDGKITYRVDGKEKVFRWGNEEDPGDGRLMASFHSGDMKIFNSQVVPGIIDLRDCRYDMKKTEEVLAKIKDEQLTDFKETAQKLFPKTEDSDQPHVFPDCEIEVEHKPVAEIPLKKLAGRPRKNIKNTTPIKKTRLYIKSTDWIADVKKFPLVVSGFWEIIT